MTKRTQRHAQQQDEQQRAQREDKVQREKRMDEIGEQHDLASCMTDNCALCEEYYALLKQKHHIGG